MATLNILYEDPHILVCVKPHGIATQSKSIRYPDMVSLIKNHLAKSSGSRNPGSAEPICSAKENGSKIARLHYDTVPVTDWLFTAPAAFHGTELEIHLDTGRHHQIRVQLASVGCPIVGDTKYNQELSDTTGWQTIRLCAYKLDFKHPITHKTMHFQLANDPV